MLVVSPTNKPSSRGDIYSRPFPSCMSYTFRRTIPSDFVRWMESSGSYLHASSFPKGGRAGCVAAIAAGCFQTSAARTVDMHWPSSSSKTLRLSCCHCRGRSLYQLPGQWISLDLWSMTLIHCSCRAHAMAVQTAALLVYVLWQDLHCRPPYSYRNWKVAIV